MPIPMERGLKAIDACSHVCNSGDILNNIGARGNDLQFLFNFLGDPRLKSIFEVQRHLSKNLSETSHGNSLVLSQELIQDLNSVEQTYNVDQLKTLLSDSHFMALLSAHDDIADRRFEEDLPLDSMNISPFPEQSPYTVAEMEDVRYIQIRKAIDEPLGMTVSEVENGQYLVVARVMAGGLTDKTGLLRVGDRIYEVNEHVVCTPEDLQEAMRQGVDGVVTFKIVPAYSDQAASQHVFMKALFTYNPDKDNLIPCREAGLPFKEGEILEILNVDDANWWQARHVGDFEFGMTNKNPAGLVPSQQLEERRKAFVRPDFDMTSSTFCGITIKKKRKIMFNTKSANDLDNLDVSVYEEVARMPPFMRKTLILLGAPGVGRRSLKSKFMHYDRARFGSPIAHTSRPLREGDVNGQRYNHISSEEFEEGIKQGSFLEFGEHGGYYYGTKLQSVKEVFRRGLMCIVDCNPQGAKMLKQQAEFMPLVIMILAPPLETLKSMYFDGIQQGLDLKPKTERDFRSIVEESKRIEDKFHHLADLLLINDNFDLCFKQVLDAVENLSMEAQWVPVSWVYGPPAHDG